MGSSRNIKLLEEIRNWNCEQLINALEINGLGECCEAIRKKDIDGDSFLNLTETQLAFWRNLLTNTQIRRLWSCMQQAKENPQQFIPQNITTFQTNKKSVVTDRIANLRGQQNASRKPDLPENKPKLKPHLSIKRENSSEISPTRGGNQENNSFQRAPKPPMPLKPAQPLRDNNFQKFPPKPNTSSAGNTVKTGKVQTKIAERLENLFGQNNQPIASTERDVPVSSSSVNHNKNVPFNRRHMENNVESEDEDLVDYENFNKEDDNNFDDEEQTFYENNISLNSNTFPSQSTAPSPSKPSKVGKFRSPITEQLENLLGPNRSGISQDQEIQETSEYFHEQDEFSSSGDEWNDNISTPSPINTPPPPPRPANNTFLFSKKPPVPVPTLDISSRPPIPVPSSNSFSKPSQKSPFLPPSSGSFSNHQNADESEYVKENIYEAEPDNEDGYYEAEPKSKKENNSNFEPMSPIYKVPRPNPQPVRRDVPPPSIISRPLPQPPVDEPLFPLPPNVVPILPINKPPIKSPVQELPRPPVVFPPAIPPIATFHDHDDEVEYDQVDDSQLAYRSQRWFLDIERREAAKLLYGQTNGSFIVRPSRKPEIECAFSVIHDNKVYNLPVNKESGKLQFGKNTFHHVTEIVERFQLYPLVLNGPNNEDVYVKLRL